MGEIAKDAEIVVLRHQLAVLRRQVARPRFRWSDRALVAVLARLVPRERWSAFLVTPETILRWRRALVRRRWSYSHRRAGRPPLPGTTVELIVRLARENPRWGYLRIVGELKKLGIVASKGSVANVLRRQRPSASAAASWTDLDRVPPCPGQGHRGHGVLHRRHSAPPPLLRDVRDRGRAQGCPPPRRHRQPQRPLGDPGRPQLRRRSRRRRSASPVFHPRSRHQVHRQLRRGLLLDRRRDHPHPGRAPRRRTPSPNGGCAPSGRTASTTCSWSPGDTWNGSSPSTSSTTTGLGPTRPRPRAPAPVTGRARRERSAARRPRRAHP